MGIRDRLINFLQRPASVEEKQEEKTIDFSGSIPGYSGGAVYYYTPWSNDKAYSSIYVVNRCVNILAHNLSRLSLRIYNSQGEPLPQDYILPRGFNIKQPHPRMSLSKLLYECGVYYWYKGEFMALIDEENPFSLEPMDPALLTINVSDGRNIESWKYNREIIDAENLIYVPMMNPDSVISSKLADKDRKVSIVDVIKREITNYLNSREFNIQFFANYAQLGTLLTDEEGMTTKEDRQWIADQMDNRLSKGNAYKTRVLPKGIGVADRKSPTMREMEFSQSLKDIRDIILGAYGIPRSVFGITNEAGLAQNTVDVEDKVMWTKTIQPAAYQIQEAFNQTLMKKYYPGYTVKFDYSVIDVLQESMKEKAELAIQMQNLGYTTNEINDKLELGMEETNDTRMNERFHPNTLLPYSEVEFSLEEPTKAVEEVETKEIPQTEKKAVRTQKYRKKFENAQKATEKVMVGKLGRYFAKQLGLVLGLVKDNNKVVKDINETLLLTDIANLLNDEKKVLISLMDPIYRDAAEKGSGMALDVLDLNTAPQASERIVQRLTNEIVNINNHTYRLIRTQVKDAINAGESIDDITKRIQQVYKFNKARARTIARTESLKVLSRSTDEEYQKAGVKMKQWLSSPGARDSHSACSAQGKIPYEQAFINGLQFPGDAGPAAEVINCRCSLAPVIE